jgi:hypothetical protein
VGGSLAPITVKATLASLARSDCAVRQSPKNLYRSGYQQLNGNGEMLVVNSVTVSPVVGGCPCPGDRDLCA